MCPTEIILGVVLTLTAASFALNLVAEMITVTWYPKAHSLVQVAGLDGHLSWGILDSGATMMMKKQTRSTPWISLHNTDGPGAENIAVGTL